MRFVRLILIAVIFLAGYYVGHLPSSPDIFGGAVKLYRCVARTTEEVATMAQRDDVSLPKAALHRLFDAAEDQVASQD